MEDSSLQTLPTSAKQTIQAYETIIAFMQLFYAGYSEPFHIRGEYFCRIPNCSRHFSRQDKFFKHVRETKDTIHEALAKVLDLTNCTQCHTTFRSLDGLTRHEQKEHKFREIRLNRLIFGELSAPNTSK